MNPECGHVPNSTQNCSCAATSELRTFNMNYYHNLYGSYYNEYHSQGYSQDEYPAPGFEGSSKVGLTSPQQHGVTTRTPRQLNGVPSPKLDALVSGQMIDNTSKSQGKGISSSTYQPRKDNIALSDSGCASQEAGDQSVIIPRARDGHKSAQIIKAPLVAASQTETKPEDTSMIPELRRKFIEDLCKKISDSVRLTEGVGDVSSLVEVLPSLIKAFAVKIGSDDSDGLSLNIMRFLHKHHGSVIPLLTVWL
jgi:hypothetical protein